jgi:hypothetical protein
MLRSLQLVPAEYHHAFAAGEALALRAYWKWQDDGAAIGRPLDARAVVAGLRYALLLAEASCGGPAARAGRDGAEKAVRVRSAHRRGNEGSAARGRAGA